MAKRSGLGASLLVDEFDISGDIGAITSAETTRSLLDVSALNQSAAARITGLRDGGMAFASFWNMTAGQAIPVLNTLPRTDRMATFFLTSTLGDAGASIKGKQLTYAVTRGQDGTLGATTELRANGLGMGLEWGEMLTLGKQTLASGTTDTTSIDGGASNAPSTFGLAAYLHVISIDSGTATIHIQDSANNSAFSDVSGGAFTDVTAAGSERIQTSATGNVRRYVRLEIDGDYANLVFAVNFIRYSESVTA